MGDIRNKLAKIERAKRDKEAMEAFLRASGYKPVRLTVGPIPVCQCGKNYYETTIVVHQADRWRDAQYFCSECAPSEVKKIMGW